MSNGKVREVRMRAEASLTTIG
ncbi:MAG: hypothetical protein QOG20_4151, partial [Pseudonocardiales bacterium]|nr:hypothetical protein [Pseudonocardiales bacterium]